MYNGVAFGPGQEYKIDSFEAVKKDSELPPTARRFNYRILGRNLSFRPEHTTMGPWGAQDIKGVALQNYITHAKGAVEAAGIVPLIVAGYGDGIFREVVSSVCADRDSPETGYVFQVPLTVEADDEVMANMRLGRAGPRHVNLMARLGGHVPNVDMYYPTTKIGQEVFVLLALATEDWTIQAIRRAISHWYASVLATLDDDGKVAVLNSCDSDMHKYRSRADDITSMDLIRVMATGHCVKCDRLAKIMEYDVPF